MSERTTNVVTVQALVAATLACGLSTVPPIAAQGAAAPKTCALLPMSEIEARFGKVTSFEGSDNPAIATCIAHIQARDVKLTKAPTGTPGFPATVQAGIQLAYKNAAGPAGRSFDTNDFGTMGCFRMVSSRDATGQKLAKPVYETTCFQVEGGYLGITARSDEPAEVAYDVVKALLEKTATGQKKS